MSRFILLASLAALCSCSTTPEESGLFSASDNVLVEQRRELYIDSNNMRRGRRVCEYRDGSTVTVEGGYNCPAVYPEDE